jgi:hypothetical protein
MTPDIIPKLLKVAAAHGHAFELEHNIERIRRGRFDAGDRWLPQWAAQELPEATRAQIDHTLTLRVDSWTAEQIANFLNVTFEARYLLKLWSFGAAGMSREERLAETKRCKNAVDINRARQLRRQRGKQARAQYEAESLSKTQPWKLVGMSRPTWYRRGKPSLAQRLPPAQRGKRARRSLRLPAPGSAS